MRFLRSFLFGAAGISLAGIASADFIAADWRYEKEIARHVGGDPYVALLLDGGVFSHAAPGLRDLRILDDRSTETPYQLAVERAERTREAMPSRLFNVVALADETQFTLELLREGALHDAVTIATPSENFRREVIVEGSADGERWGTLSDDGFIYDVTVRRAGRIDFRTQETTARYPQTTFRFLRVRILDRGEPPVTVSNASVFSFREEEAMRISYNLDALEQTEDAERRATVAAFDFGSEGLPTDEIVLQIPGENFNRDVSLEGSNDRERWTTLKTRDVLFRYKTPKFTGEKSSVAYPESAYRYLRLTIFNEDNPPLRVTGASASGILRRIVFPHDPARSYRLLYGNAEARYPQYDLARYFQYLELEDIPEVSLGPERPNPAFVEKIPPPPPVSERFPWLLPAALVSVVVVFGFLFVRTIRSLNRRKSA